MKGQEIIYTNNHKVSCKGGENFAEHPLIYLEIKEEQVTCPYCSRIFKLNKK